jgi:hypothetical protein
LPPALTPNATIAPAGHASKDTLIPKRHSELLKEALNAQSAALGKEPTAELIL